ncbi:MAG: hypothetical protein DI530_12750 [Sphingomonas sp.]|uniref:Lipoprotein n=2 Tax=Sphingomonas adhaesiva TaxID=28212 RepID=A0A2A4IC34_9SPHN|nr:MULTISPECIES: hypothetical protein [Sphingomonas]PCG15342.1 hypothetical protein COA07_07440 [Sphingomonas adhaesiva]PZU77556.1 MAG: hypothetical protein DI530_12750 [Sphingomonas sp.]
MMPVPVSIRFARRGRRALIFVLLSALAACSSPQGDYGNVAVPEREAAAQQAIEAAAATNGVRATARTGVPIEVKPLTAARGRALPADYQGYWGVTPDDCELANTAATGRINIDADTIRFHESKARVQSIALRDPYALSAELRFSGEGAGWTRRNDFRLENGGTMLVRQDGAQVVRYRKC